MLAIAVAAVVVVILIALVPAIATVLGVIVLLGSIIVLGWGTVGIVVPQKVGLPDRGSAVGAWIVSVVMFIIGAVGAWIVSVVCIAVTGRTIRHRQPQSWNRALLSFPTRLAKNADLSRRRGLAMCRECPEKRGQMANGLSPSTAAH